MVNSQQRLEETVQSSRHRTESLQNVLESQWMEGPPKIGMERSLDLSRGMPEVKTRWQPVPPWAFSTSESVAAAPFLPGPEASLFQAAGGDAI